jgi:hypothetical protein
MSWWKKLKNNYKNNILFLTKKALEVHTLILVIAPSVSWTIFQVIEKASLMNEGAVL